MVRYIKLAICLLIVICQFGCPTRGGFFMMTLSSRYRMPIFPWPPPPASAKYHIQNKSLFGNAIHDLRLKDIDSKIESALRKCKYINWSYFLVEPGTYNERGGVLNADFAGFAIASQMEQINADGKPLESESERWDTKKTIYHSDWNLIDYLRALFYGKTGYFRVMVFVVSSNVFVSGASVSYEDIQEFYQSGCNRLPSSIGNERYSDDYSIDLLIYEFEKMDVESSGRQITRLSGEKHLKQSGLADALGIKTQ